METDGISENYRNQKEASLDPLGLRERVKNAAYVLGDEALSAISSEKSKTFFRSLLEKTYYRHTFSILLLEAYTIASLSQLSAAHSAEMSKFLAIPAAITAFKWIENKIRTPKATSEPIAFAGHHMKIYEQIFRDIRTRKLSDGYVVHPGEKVGLVTFDRYIPIMKKDENLVVFTRQLIKGAEDCLKSLAKKCEGNDPALAGINVFYGASHLAGPLARKFGFDIFEIADPFKRAEARYRSKDIAADVAGENEMWQRIQQNSSGKDPREAFISKQKLIELFGSKVENT